MLDLVVPFESTDEWFFEYDKLRVIIRIVKRPQLLQREKYRIKAGNKMLI